MTKQKVISPSSWKAPENHLNLLLTDQWYRVVNNLFSSIFIATNEFYNKEKIQPSLFPITTGSISSPMGMGSDSLPVSVEINGNKIYLADSMQFCLEIGARMNEKGSYYIMPTFRGENMDQRHLNEFIHSEVEIKGNIDDVMALAERYTKYMISYLLDHNSNDISLITGDVEHLRNAILREFKSIKYADAVKELEKVPGGLRKKADDLVDITDTGEKYLLQKYGDFTWLTNLPWKLVPFYQAKVPEDSNTAYASDLLAGIGEILGSGQRVLTVKDLDDSLSEHDVNPDEYKWYREMRKIDTIQTSGFGLGIERFMLWVLKHNDIRDCTILLRDHKKIVGP